MAKRTNDTSAPEIPFEITPEGKVIIPDDMRKEPRYSSGGVAILQIKGKKPIRVFGRDVSMHGLGMRLFSELRSYRLGAKLDIEFAYPHKLSGLRIEVVLKRVRTYEDGHNDIGFEICSHNRLLVERLNGLIESLDACDPWVG